IATNKLLVLEYFSCFVFLNNAYQNYDLSTFFVNVTIRPALSSDYRPVFYVFFLRLPTGRPTVRGTFFWGGALFKFVHMSVRLLRGGFGRGFAYRFYRGYIATVAALCARDGAVLGEVLELGTMEES